MALTYGRCSAAVRADAAAISPLLLVPLLKLVHGDARIANIAIERTAGQPRATLIDWAIAGVNVAPLDLIWYLGARTPWLPGDREEAMEIYRAALQAILSRLLHAKPPSDRQVAAAMYLLSLSRPATVAAVLRWRQP